MSPRNIIVISAVLGLALGLGMHAQAQDSVNPPNHPTKSAVNVTLDVKDAPIRDVLTELFREVKVDYSIDPGVSGFVTLHLTDQPLDSALRLVLRASGEPLNYSHDGGIYIVKPRQIASIAPVAPAFASAGATQPDVREEHFAVINLVYIDPADLAQLLGIRLVPFNVRGQGMGRLGQSSTGILSGGGLYGNGGISGNGNGLLMNGGGPAGGGQGNNP